MGLNYVVLMGEVISLPEKKHTPEGQPVASFNMSFNSSSDETNDSKQGVIKVSASKKLADRIMNEIAKGLTILVEGKLHTRTIENRLGQKQKIPLIQASKIEVIKNNSSKSSIPVNDYKDDPIIKNPEDDEIPF